MRRPPGRSFGHGAQIMAEGGWRRRPRCGRPPSSAAQAGKRQSTLAGFKTVVKVIASSLRKGNVVEKDGKLYVILFAENIHPGKGTPVTQLDMRRIGDGVKVSQRYKTTEQVERAHVEDREYQYLYSDADGAHFMNMESYDQIAVPADVVGGQAAYLQPD